MGFPTNWLSQKLIFLFSLLLDCWTQGSSWRGPILETKTPTARFLHYYTECLPSLHIEENPGSKLPCDGASTHLQGVYGNKQSSWWTCEAEPNKRVCPWFGGYPHLDDEGYCCRLAEHWLRLLRFCVSFFLFFCREFTPRNHKLYAPEVDAILLSASRS